MAGTQRPVRIKLAWQGYRVGDVIPTPSNALRQWLVANGYGETVEDANQVQTSAPVRKGKAQANLGRAVIR